MTLESPTAVRVEEIFFLYSVAVGEGMRYNPHQFQRFTISDTAHIAS